MDSSDTQDDTHALEIVEKRIIRLPLEVEEHIIDSLDNEWNAGTIANCALVCRAWLLRSRSKLYSIVELHSRQQWDRFIDHMLRCESEAIAGYMGMVRELHVWQWGEQFLSRQETQRHIGWNKGQERPWSHLVLDYCSIRLAGLAYIELWGVDLSFSHDMTIRSGCHYHSLSELVLNKCTFRNLSQLLRFVTSFPALSDLSLVDLRFRLEIIPSHIPQEGHPLIRLVLHGNYGTITTMSQWLTQAQLAQNLRRLELMNLTYHPYTHMDEAEEACKALFETIDGSSHQSLCLSVGRFWRG